ncbi:MAG: hypothetical protein R3215_00150 [Halomonas sp.]|nr:hypothetical protein [Halomonas sp.]
MSDTTLQPGDAVTYVVTRKTGRGFSFSAREGKLVEISGGLAVVKARNNRLLSVRLKDLRPAGQPNALTEALAGDAS